MLQKFHGAGQSLQQKEDHCTKEMKEIQNKKAASEGRYENKKEDIDETLEGGMHIMKEFSKTVPENHLCYDHLRSILYQKAKNTTKMTAMKMKEIVLMITTVPTMTLTLVKRVLQIAIKKHLSLSINLETKNSWKKKPRGSRNN